MILENQVKGLESDEVEFLDFVSDKQSEILRAREKETEEALAEYRVCIQVFSFMYNHKIQQQFAQNIFMQLLTKNMRVFT